MQQKNTARSPETDIQRTDTHANNTPISTAIFGPPSNQPTNRFFFDNGVQLRGVWGICAHTRDAASAFPQVDGVRCLET